MIERVCIVGGGVIGSLFAGHLAQVCDVSRADATRRSTRTRSKRDGLRVTGKSERHARVRGVRRPGRAAGVRSSAIVATKATGLRAAAQALEGRFPGATVMTVLNGLGAEEIVREHGGWPLVSAVTFMSGTKHSDTHVEYILDTETWLGPVRGHAVRARAGDRGRVVASGLKAEALPDLRPAQWSKLIFNAAVNPVAALTGLPHDPHFAAEDDAGRPRPPRPRPRRRGEGGRAPRPGSSCTTTRGR